MKEMFKKEIHEHQSEYHPLDEPRDFIDIYLKQIDIERRGEGVDNNMGTSNFHIEQLATLCFDFFVAGSETTSTTLTWAVMYMVLYPEVQVKCQLEIDAHLQSR